MRRGEVWWVSFGPSIGGEIQKERPAVIVSNDAANTHLNRLQVIPLSSQTGKLYPGEAYVTLNDELRKAMADQIATVSKQRLRSKISTLALQDILQVENAIRTQLGLE